MKRLLVLILSVLVYGACEDDLKKEEKKICDQRIVSDFWGGGGNGAWKFKADATYELRTSNAYGYTNETGTYVLKSLTEDEKSIFKKEVDPAKMYYFEKHDHRPQFKLTITNTAGDFDYYIEFLGSSESIKEQMLMYIKKDSSWELEGSPRVRKN
jgi:hypothetical protein